ncbi:MAG: DUF4340 domain-containing protein [Ruminococcus sp.]|jgi:hypothetical protein
MKRRRKVTVLLAVLIVCIAAAFGISRVNFDENMTGTQTSIVDVESSDITRISWNYEEEVSFTYNDEKWAYDEDDNMPVNQDKMTEIAESLSNITSDKRVDEVKSLSLYGLDNPTYTLTVETSEDTWEISIGDESFSDGEVYISIGDEYVYLTDSELIDKISYNLYDLVQEEEIPEMDSISSVSIDKGDSTTNIIYQKNSGYCYSDAYTYYLDNDGEYQNLDNDNTEEESDAAEESAEKEDDESAFIYEIGSKDGEYYARLQDSRMVYRISSEVYDAAMNASYDELKPDEVILLDWDTVDTIDIESEGSIYTVALESNDDGEFTYTFNNMEIEFENVLDELSSITIDEETETELGDNKEELTLTFHRNTDTYSSVELTFYQYDGSYCISVLNGEVINCVNREEVISLKEDINSIILDSNSEE